MLIHVFVRLFGLASLKLGRGSYCLKATAIIKQYRHAEQTDGDRLSQPFRLEPLLQGHHQLRTDAHIRRLLRCVLDGIPHPVKSLLIASE